MADADIDALISEATKGIPDEKRRKAVSERLTAALRTAGRPSRPNFPEEWRSEPNVMFELGDPKPEPFEWGPLKWKSQEGYEEELAKFFGKLACGADVPEAQVQDLARRAISHAPRWGARVYTGGSRAIAMIGDRLVQPHNMLAGGWPRSARLFAAGLIESDCPPAKRLPKEMRRQLELAAQGRPLRR